MMPLRESLGSPERRAAALADVLRRRGITDEHVLDAIRTVPRHELVPAPLRAMAYRDAPLPIGAGQTISQPFIVALMTQLAALEETDRVLEIGTGSGYQAAVLAHIAGEVYTIEVVKPLAERARRDLERLGLAGNIHFRVGNGRSGWPEAAPFDAIVATAAPTEVPEPLLSQLRAGGRLVIPVGEHEQSLRVHENTGEGFVARDALPVRFVPMTEGA